MNFTKPSMFPISHTHTHKVESKYNAVPDGLSNVVKENAKEAQPQENQSVEDV